MCLQKERQQFIGLSTNDICVCLCAILWTGSDFSDFVGGAPRIAKGYSFNIEYPEYPECFLDGIDLKIYYIFAIW